MSRRSMLAGTASLMLHGVVGLLAVAVMGEHSHAPRHEVAYTEIEVVDAAPSAPPTLPPPPAVAPASPAPVALRARRPPIQRPQPSAPATIPSLADLEIDHDDPAGLATSAATAGKAAGDVRPAGLSTALRQGGDGVAALQIPQPPVVSRAGPPRPRFDYSKLRLMGVSAGRFAGQRIKLILGINARGRVRQVQLVQGVDRDLDRRAIALVRAFEFDPALDADGVATSGTFPYYLDIVEDEDEAPSWTTRERSHL